MYTIYALVDPRTMCVRYVGQTRYGLATRLRGHLCPSSLAKQTDHSAWLRDLVSLGLEPIAVVLQQIAASERRICAPRLAEQNVAERAWIKRFLDTGANLTNVRIARPVSIETRRKIREAALRHYASVRAAHAH